MGEVRTKKRLLSMVLVAAMTAGLAGCVQKPGASGSTDSNSAGTAAESDAEAGSSREGCELALITDVGTIDDRPSNQGSWEGLEAYTKGNNLTCKYYKPSKKSDETCISSISLIVKGGAGVIMTPGFLFEAPIYELQTEYPDIKSIIIDVEPKSGDDIKVENSVLSIFHAEERAGYLAGYTAVTEGYTQLGFIDGIAAPVVICYGCGPVQSTDTAVKEMGPEPRSVSVKHTYVGNLDASPENNAKAAAWYNEGTGCIFACDGSVDSSVMKATESAGKVVIDADVNQSSESATIITSATKNLGDSVYDVVVGYYDGNFEGGKSATLDTKEDGIMLLVKTSKLKVFTQEKYDELYEMLRDGTIQVVDDVVVTQASAVPTDIVKVDLIK